MRTSKFHFNHNRNAQGLIAVIGVTLAVLVFAVMPVQSTYAQQPQVTCPTQKHIQNWTNSSQLAAHGFFTEIFNPSTASLTFNKVNGDGLLNFNLAANPSFAGPVASRITEIDTSFPVDQRVKCWQPSTNSTITAEVTMRFAQASPPPGLTENIFFWNAPLGATAIPLTSIGVTRSLNPFTGQQMYAAIVAQDLDFSTFSGLLQLAPMPEWLDATAWHTVRITISNETATVEVTQGAQTYTTVLTTSLLHSPEPLGFELSVDNEVFPGVFAPVTVPDTLTVGSLDISATP